MSKLNSTNRSAIADGVRLAGGFGALAAEQSPIELLRRATLANLLWEDVAYMDGAKVADEISRLIPLCAPDDVFDLAIEVRLKQKLRHTPLFIAVEMCKHDGHRGLVGTLLPKIITRPDMLTDFMALYWADGKCTVCNQARKGLAEAFHNFDEYQFAKYDRDAPIKLRDVMFLAHPKARTDDEQILFRKIADRELSTPDTWEVALSSGEDKKEAWTRLVSSRKLGALATLRNISNMKRASVDKEVISDAILNAKSSMLLPLDFYKAARQNSEFARDIEEAMQNAYLNLPKLPGRTLFIVDISGSMRCNISGRSDFSRLEVACMMAMLASYQCEQFELVATSGDDSKRLCSSKHIKYPSRGFDIIDDIENAGTGNGGIFTRQCLEWCKVKFAGIHFDRIIVFSDSQDCDYPDKRTPKPFGVRNYICDVSAHTRGINYKGVWTAEISGWSEHFLTFIASLEGMENTFEN